jgi:hypothetical protein
MGVLGDLLAPGVEDGQKTDASPEVLRVGGDLEQRLGGTGEQSIEEPPLIAPDQIVSSAGRVKTTWKYGTGKSSSRRLSSQRSWSRV